MLAKDPEEISMEQMFRLKLTQWIRAKCGNFKEHSLKTRDPGRIKGRQMVENHSTC